MKERILIKKEDVISYKDGDNFLVKTGDYDLVFTKEALEEMILDGIALGLVNVLDNTQEQEPVVEEDVIEEEPVVEEDVIEEEPEPVIEEEPEPVVEEEPVIDCVKTKYLDVKDILLIFFIIFSILNFFLLMSIKRSVENKNVTQVIQTESNGEQIMLDTTTYKISSTDSVINLIETETQDNKKYYGMWPITKENGYLIHTNHSLEFKVDNNYIGNYYAISYIINNMEVALNKVSNLRKEGFKDSNILIKYGGEHQLDIYLVYLYRNANKDSLLNDLAKTNKKVEFIQLILE